MKSIKQIVVLGVLTLLISATAPAQGKKPPSKPNVERQASESNPGMRPPSAGPSFYIAPVEGSTGMFSVLLGNGAGETVAGTFTLNQLNVFEAVLEAAKAFALTDEKVGSGAAITTRLMEQHEWSMFVDVSKIGNQSQFYVTLITPHGRLTAEAGEITRGSKKEPSGLLLTILSQVRDVKANSTAHQ